MTRYTSSRSFRHDRPHGTAVLLVNLGTPDAPTASALRRYLAEFLSDPRVVEIPRPVWWLVLHLIILRLRPRRSARLYREIWTDQGSPLLVYSQRLAGLLNKALQPRQVTVALAMRYGRPSIAKVLRELRESGLTRLLVLPLYPQYSASTTASCFDAISNELQHWRRVPEVRFISQYHDYPDYIEALAAGINDFRQQQQTGEKLLFSFHGIPQRYFQKGDPYFCHCQKTARLVAERLGLVSGQWQVTFQSRFGREPWLQPYTDRTLKELAAAGVQNVDIVCPGFACDCLETLQEIAIENRRLFLDAGGRQLNYIPALNDQPSHVSALAALLDEHLQGWPEVSDGEQAGKTAARARDMGAGS